MQNAKGREERDNKQRIDIDRMKSHLRGPGFLNTRSGMQVREKEANRTRSRYCLDRVRRPVISIIAGLCWQIVSLERWTIRTRGGDIRPWQAASNKKRHPGLEGVDVPC